MMVSCQYSFLCRLKLVSQIQEIGFKMLGMEHQRGWPSSDSSWQCYYMLGTTTKFSMPFQVLGL